MDRTLVGAAVVALSMAGTLPAQQASQAPGTSDTLTLTGCLDRAPNGTYHLLEARIEASRATGVTGTSGATTGAPGASGAAGAAGAATAANASTWILESTTDLAPHVGHEVQVTGRPGVVRPPANDRAATAPPTTPSTGAGVKNPDETARSIDVRDVRMIARACS